MFFHILFTYVDADGGEVLYFFAGRYETELQEMILITQFRSDPPHWEKPDFGVRYFEDDEIAWPGDSGYGTGAWVVSENGPPPATIIAILNFFDDSVADGTLECIGPGKSARTRLNAFENMLGMTDDLINIEDVDGACGQLNAASRKCDGNLPPPDFVAGPATLELYKMIFELMENLGCE